MKSRITKEQFSKLNQLDRIEYRQRYYLTEKYYDNDFGSWYFVNKMFIIMGFIILISVSFYNIDSGVTFRLLSVIPLLIKLTVMFFVILLGGEIFMTIKRIKELKKLEEEYFKVEIKTKK